MGRGILKCASRAAWTESHAFCVPVAEQDINLSTVLMSAGCFARSTYR